MGNFTVRKFNYITCEIAGKATFSFGILEKLCMCQFVERVKRANLTCSDCHKSSRHENE